jgi:hypothetical protein
VSIRTLRPSVQPNATSARPQAAGLHLRRSTGTREAGVPTRYRTYQSRCGCIHFHFANASQPREDRSLSCTSDSSETAEHEPA